MPDGARGHTLLEVLVAMSLMAIAILGIASLLLRGLAAHSVARHHETANNLLADLGAQLRANAGAPLSPQQQTAWQQAAGQRLPALASAPAGGTVAAAAPIDGAARWDVTLHWGSTETPGGSTLQRVLVLPQAPAP